MHAPLPSTIIWHDCWLADSLLFQCWLLSQVRLSDVTVDWLTLCYFNVGSSPKYDYLTWLLIGWLSVISMHAPLPSTIIWRDCWLADSLLFQCWLLSQVRLSDMTVDWLTLCYFNADSSPKYDYLTWLLIGWLSVISMLAPLPSTIIWHDCWLADSLLFQCTLLSQVRLSDMTVDWLTLCYFNARSSPKYDYLTWLLIGWLSVISMLAPLPSTIIWHDCWLADSLLFQYTLLSQVRLSDMTVDWLTLCYFNARSSPKYDYLTWLLIGWLSVISMLAPLPSTIIWHDCWLADSLLFQCTLLSQVRLSDMTVDWLTLCYFNARSSPKYDYLTWLLIGWLSVISMLAPLPSTIIWHDCWLADSLLFQCWLLSQVRLSDMTVDWLTLCYFNAGSSPKYNYLTWLLIGWLSVISMHAPLPSTIIWHDCWLADSLLFQCTLLSQVRLSDMTVDWLTLCYFNARSSPKYDYLTWLLIGWLSVISMLAPLPSTIIWHDCWLADSLLFQCWLLPQVRLSDMTVDWLTLCYFNAGSSPKYDYLTWLLIGWLSVISMLAPPPSTIIWHDCWLADSLLFQCWLLPQVRLSDMTVDWLTLCYFNAGSSPKYDYLTWLLIGWLSVISMHAPLPSTITWHDCWLADSLLFQCTLLSQVRLSDMTVDWLTLCYFNARSSPKYDYLTWLLIGWLSVISMLAPPPSTTIWHDCWLADSLLFQCTLLSQVRLPDMTVDWLTLCYFNARSSPKYDYLTWLLIGWLSVISMLTPLPSTIIWHDCWLADSLLFQCWLLSQVRLSDMTVDWLTLCYFNARSSPKYDYLTWLLIGWLSVISMHAPLPSTIIWRDCWLADSLLFQCTLLSQVRLPDMTVDWLTLCYFNADSSPKYDYLTWLLIGWLSVISMLAPLPSTIIWHDCWLADSLLFQCTLLPQVRLSDVTVDWLTLCYFNAGSSPKYDYLTWLLIGWLSVISMHAPLPSTITWHDCWLADSLLFQCWLLSQVRLSDMTVDWLTLCYFNAGSSPKYDYLTWLLIGWLSVISMLAPLPSTIIWHDCWLADSLLFQCTLLSQVRLSDMTVDWLTLCYFNARSSPKYDYLTWLLIGWLSVISMHAPLPSTIIWHDCWLVDSLLFQCTLLSQVRLSDMTVDWLTLCYFNARSSPKYDYLTWLLIGWLSVISMHAPLPSTITWHDCWLADSLLFQCTLLSQVRLSDMTVDWLTLCYFNARSSPKYDYLTWLLIGWLSVISMHAPLPSTIIWHDCWLADSLLFQCWLLPQVRLSDMTVDWLTLCYFNARSSPKYDYLTWLLIGWLSVISMHAPLPSTIIWHDCWLADSLLFQCTLLPQVRLSDMTVDWLTLCYFNVGSSPKYDYLTWLLIGWLSVISMHAPLPSTIIWHDCWLADSLLFQCTLLPQVRLSDMTVDWLTLCYFNAGSSPKYDYLTWLLIGWLSVISMHAPPPSTIIWHDCWLVDSLLFQCTLLSQVRLSDMTVDWLTLCYFNARSSPKYDYLTWLLIGWLSVISMHAPLPSTIIWHDCWLADSLLFQCWLLSQVRLSDVTVDWLTLCYFNARSSPKYDYLTWLLIGWLSVISMHAPLPSTIIWHDCWLADCLLFQCTLLSQVRLSDMTVDWLTLCYFNARSSPKYDYLTWLLIGWLSVISMLAPLPSTIIWRDCWLADSLLFQCTLLSQVRLSDMTVDWLTLCYFNVGSSPKYDYLTWLLIGWLSVISMHAPLPSTIIWRDCWLADSLLFQCTLLSQVRLSDVTVDWLTLCYFNARSSPKYDYLTWLLIGWLSVISMLAPPPSTIIWHDCWLADSLLFQCTLLSQVRLSDMTVDWLTLCYFNADSSPKYDYLTWLLIGWLSVISMHAPLPSTIIWHDCWLADSLLFQCTLLSQVRLSDMTVDWLTLCYFNARSSPKYDYLTWLLIGWLSVISMLTPLPSTIIWHDCWLADSLLFQCTLLSQVRLSDMTVDWLTLCYFNARSSPKYDYLTWLLIGWLSVISMHAPLPSTIIWHDCWLADSLLFQCWLLSQVRLSDMTVDWLTLCYFNARSSPKYDYLTWLLIGWLSVISMHAPLPSTIIWHDCWLADSLLFQCWLLSQVRLSDMTVDWLTLCYFNARSSPKYDYLTWLLIGWLSVISMHAPLPSTIIWHDCWLADSLLFQCWLLSQVRLSDMTVDWLTLCYFNARSSPKYDYLTWLLIGWLSVISMHAPLPSTIIWHDCWLADSLLFQCWLLSQVRLSDMTVDWLTLCYFNARSSPKYDYLTWLSIGWLSVISMLAPPPSTIIWRDCWLADSLLFQCTLLSQVRLSDMTVDWLTVCYFNVGSSPKYDYLTWLLIGWLSVISMLAPLPSTIIWHDCWLADSLLFQCWLLPQIRLSDMTVDWLTLCYFNARSSPKYDYLTWLLIGWLSVISMLAPPPSTIIWRDCWLADSLLFQCTLLSQVRLSDMTVDWLTVCYFNAGSSPKYDYLTWLLIGWLSVISMHAPPPSTIIWRDCWLADSLLFQCTLLPQVRLSDMTVDWLTLCYFNAGSSPKYDYLTWLLIGWLSVISMHAPLPSTIIWHDCWLADCLLFQCTLLSQVRLSDMTVDWLTLCYFNACSSPKYIRPEHSINRLIAGRFCDG